MFDGVGFVSDPVVVIDGDTIIDVGHPDIDVPVTDLGEVTLLPGLIDTHQHLVFNGQGGLFEQVDGVSDEDLRQRARDHAARALQAGITTVRDLGDRAYVTLDLRDDPELPRILCSGPPITVNEGHCWFLGGECGPGDGILDAVRERHARGCDVIKIMVTGGALTPTYPMWRSQFDGHDVARAVALAHDLGLPVAAHCHGPGGIADAVAAGVDTIEHCSFATEGDRAEPDDRTLRRIAADGIVVSATLGMLPQFSPPPQIAARLATVFDAFRTLRSYGGTIVAGTDAGISPGKPHDVLPRAVDMFAQIGIEGEDALAALTSVAARAIGIDHLTGRIAPGLSADLLSVAGDPSTDPAALLEVRGVWARGRQVVGER